MNTNFAFLIFKDFQTPISDPSLFAQPDWDGHNSVCICKTYSSAVAVLGIGVKYFIYFTIRKRLTIISGFHKYF